MIKEDYKLVGVKRQMKREPRKESVTPIEVFFDRQLEIMKEMQQTNAELHETIKALSSYIMEKDINVQSEIPVVVENKRKIKEEKSDTTEIHKLCDACIVKYHRFSTRREVLNFVWDRMTNAYSVVWSQEKKDFYKKYGYKPIHNLQTVLAYKDQGEDMLYDITISILEDMSRGKKYDLSSPHKTFSTSSDIKEIHKAIMDYADKVGNKSAQGTSIYRKLFLRMDVDWNEYPVPKGKKKMDIVKQNMRLKKEFVKQLNILLEEE